eukprot:gene11853-11997_t
MPWLPPSGLEGRDRSDEGGIHRAADELMGGFHQQQASDGGSIRGNLQPLDSNSQSLERSPKADDEGNVVNQLHDGSSREELSGAPDQDRYAALEDAAGEVAAPAVTSTLPQQTKPNTDTAANHSAPTSSNIPLSVDPGGGPSPGALALEGMSPAEAVEAAVGGTTGGSAAKQDVGGSAAGVQQTNMEGAAAEASATEAAEEGEAERMSFQRNEQQGQDVSEQTEDAAGGLLISGQQITATAAGAVDAAGELAESAGRAVYDVAQQIAQAAGAAADASVVVTKQATQAAGAAADSISKAAVERGQGAAQSAGVAVQQLKALGVDAGQTLASASQTAAGTAAEQLGAAADIIAQQVSNLTNTAAAQLADSTVTPAEKLSRGAAGVAAAAGSAGEEVAQQLATTAAFAAQSSVQAGKMAAAGGAQAVQAGGALLVQGVAVGVRETPRVAGQGAGLIARLVAASNIAAADMSSAGGKQLQVQMTGRHLQAGFSSGNDSSTIFTGDSHGGSRPGRPGGAGKSETAQGPSAAVQPSPALADPEEHGLHLERRVAHLIPAVPPVDTVSSDSAGGPGPLDSFKALGATVANGLGLAQATAVDAAAGALAAAARQASGAADAHDESNLTLLAEVHSLLGTQQRLKALIASQKQRVQQLHEDADLNMAAAQVVRHETDDAERLPAGDSQHSGKHGKAGSSRRRQTNSKQSEVSTGGNSVAGDVEHTDDATDSSRSTEETPVHAGGNLHNTQLEVKELQRQLFEVVWTLMEEVVLVLVVVVVVVAEEAEEAEEVVGAVVGGQGGPMVAVMGAWLGVVVISGLLWYAYQLLYKLPIQEVKQMASTAVHAAETGAQIAQKTAQAASSVAGAVGHAAGVSADPPGHGPSRHTAFKSATSKLGRGVKSVGQIMARVASKTSIAGKRFLQVLLMPPSSPASSSDSGSSLAASKSDNNAALAAAAARVGAGLVMLVAAGSLADAADRRQHQGRSRKGRNRSSSLGLYQGYRHDNSRSSSWVGQLSGKLLSSLSATGKLAGGTLVAAAKAPWTTVNWLRHRKGQKQRPWWEQQQHNVINGGSYEDLGSLSVTSSIRSDLHSQPAVRADKAVLASGDASIWREWQPPPSTAAHRKPQLQPSSGLHKLSVIHAAEDQHGHMYRQLMLRQGSWR